VQISSLTMDKLDPAAAATLQECGRQAHRVVLKLTNANCRVRHLKVLDPKRQKISKAPANSAGMLMGHPMRCLQKTGFRARRDNSGAGNPFETQSSDTRALNAGDARGCNTMP
jgi:hypothetical protein